MVAPVGMLSLPIDLLRETVAGSATFQTWTGTASQALAKPRVHAVGALASDTLPLAAVGWSPAYTRRRIARGAHNQFEATGALRLLFRDAITEATLIDAYYAFLNEVGEVIREMELIAGTATYLDIESFTLEDGPYRPEENEAETASDYFEIIFTVEFRSK